MRRAVLFVSVVVLAAIFLFRFFAEEPVVRRSTIAFGTVKRGNMPVSLRALGRMTAKTTAELNIPAGDAGLVRSGQVVLVDLQDGSVGHGKLTGIDPEVVNGRGTVLVALDRPLPPAAAVGASLYGTIEITTLSDVIYIGRPVFARSGTEASLFKLSRDGRNATRVKVAFGESSFNTVEIRAGLQPGEKVILSDMSRYKNRERLRLE